MTKWTAKLDGVASPTALYLCLEHKEANTGIIVSQLDVSHFQQIKTTLPYIQIGGGIFYQVWKKGEDEDMARENIYEYDSTSWVVVKYNLFHGRRQGFLDEKLLKKLGVTQCIIREREFLFYQILLPLCETSLYIIREEKQLPYYSEVDKWSNIYAYHIDFGGSYGHIFKTVNIYEMFCHYGFIVRDGVQNGTSSEMFC